MNTTSINDYLDRCHLDVTSGVDQRVCLMHVHDVGVFCFGMTPTQARAMASALVLHADAVDVNIAESEAVAA